MNPRRPASQCLLAAISDRLSGMALVLAAALLLAGCASTSTVSVVATVADLALQASGLKKPAPAGPPPPKMVPVRIHAGDNLNADPSGRPLAMVTKVYKLRDTTAFMQAPYATFTNSAKEKEALGADIVEVREVILTPGQRFESKERMTQEMPYLGVVALFRAPAPQRWRFAFAQADIEQQGVTIGAHACALTVTAGKIQGGVTDDEPGLLSPVQCR